MQVKPRGPGLPAAFQKEALAWKRRLERAEGRRRHASSSPEKTVLSFTTHQVLIQGAKHINT
jgi:hypothetical protein